MCACSFVVGSKGCVRFVCLSVFGTVCVLLVIACGLFEPTLSKKPRGSRLLHSRLVSPPESLLGPKHFPVKLGEVVSGDCTFLQ